jgi:hypothetical protein
MIHSIKIIFGKEQVNKFLSDVPFSKEEKSINEKEYHFETQLELDAFLKGVNETVGWLECYIVEGATV